MSTDVMRMREELAPAPSEVLPSPVFRGQQMVTALHAYRELQRALDEAMPEQLMTLDGKPFRKKGYWRAVSVAFNLSVEPITDPTTERSVIGTLEDGTDNYVYTVSYRATAPNGRSAVGDGTCAAAEKQRGRMKATDHNVRSHAHTRAWNRAVSNLVGFGEVSAEEVERGDERHDEPAQVRRPDGLVLVQDITSKQGQSKKGPWTMYLITFDDGRSGSTFDESLARVAQRAKAAGELVRPGLERKGDFWNVTSLEAVSAPAEADGLTTAGNAPDDADTPISDAQRNKLFAVMRGQGWTEDDVHDVLAREFGLDSITAITRGVYDDVLNAIKAVSKK